MNYEFSANYRRRDRPRLVITVRLGGDIPGQPDLVKLPSESADELLYRLVFRPPGMNVFKSATHCEPMDSVPRPLRRIRILLPDYQEFILLGRESDCGPHHPIPLSFTPYYPD
jgi:hypothetical protein